MMNTPSKMRLLMAAMVAVSTSAWAQADAYKAERCAIRLSVALHGKSPASTLLTSQDPQSSVDQMLASPDFIERFSRFVNATFNDEPGQNTAEDAAYHMAKYVLQNNRPWEEMFLGQYNLNVTRDANGNVTGVNVVADPNGVGYFRWRDWMVRYAGNEEQGIKISTAYRMMHNTVGLRLVASTNAPGADVSATGRQAAGCRACHYDSWFALDKTAEVLGKVQRSGMNVTFSNYTGPAQPLLGGIMVANDKELATALVKSEAFKFYTCRLAFQFLYGRPEATCEGPIFDACMNEFSAKGTIQSALAVIAKHPTYCQ